MAAKKAATPSKPTSAKGEKTKKGGKAKKTGPKKPLSAFMFFSMERRKQIVEQHPELKSKIADVSKLIGEEWQALPAGDKEKFTKLNEKDKKRYESEMSKTAA